MYCNRLRNWINLSYHKELLEQGIELITKVKKNIKEKFFPILDKILLRKRAVIEFVNDELKNTCQIKHSKHRSYPNFLINFFSGLVAYSFKPHKPSINFSKKDLELVTNLPSISF
jgi:hypothetical protein